MRVLQVIPDLSISNGAMSMIMNYQRAMSADVQFDYLYFLDTQADRRAEIEALGGHAYKMDFPKPKDVLPTKKMRAFFWSIRKLGRPCIFTAHILRYLWRRRQKWPVCAISLCIAIPRCTR